MPSIVLGVFTLVASNNSYNWKHFPDVELGLREVKAFAQSHRTNKWWAVLLLRSWPTCQERSALHVNSSGMQTPRTSDFVEKNECKTTPSPSRILPNSRCLGQGAAPLGTHVYTHSPTSFLFPHSVLSPFVPTAIASYSTEKWAPFFLLKNTCLSLPSPRLSSIQRGRVGVKAALDDN